MIELVEATALLTLLNASNVPLAKCMDGTPGGYYHAANASSRSWIIELEGGGECVDKADCDKHIHSALGSSNFFLKNTTLKFFLQDDAVANPRLRQMNRVYVPYCSQDLWTGQRVAASDETFGYFFSGHYVLEGVLDALDALGLAGAHDIILTGESAGGIGVWPNAKIGVMGGEQAASVLSEVRVGAAKSAGKPLGEAEVREYYEETRQRYDKEASAYFATARLWDDGIIEPTQTRHVLALALEMAANAPIPDTQHGIFRM